MYLNQPQTVSRVRLAVIVLIITPLARLKAADVPIFGYSLFEQQEGAWVYEPWKHSSN
jgi:hypothetical protein